MNAPSRRRYYAHPAAWPEDTLLDACGQSQGRSSGPGGQHRNKVSTQVTLIHKATGISAQAGERRSMIENRSVALRRLRLALATLHRINVPDGEIGSALFQERRTKIKHQPAAKEKQDPVFASLGIDVNEHSASTPRYGLSISPRHKEYPALLAELMDVLAATGWIPKDAAVRLEISASQLLRVIRNHPPALAHVNMQRESRTLRPLK